MVQNAYIPFSAQKPKDYYMMPESELKLADASPELVRQQNAIEKNSASQLADKSALRDTVQGASMAASGGGGLSSALVGGGVTNMLSTGAVSAGGGAAVAGGLALQYLQQKEQERIQKEKDAQTAFLTKQQNQMTAMQSLINTARGLGVGA